MSNKHTSHSLAQLQSLPLEAKITLTKSRIRQWCEHWDDKVYISFSGGKDSTALLNLVRSIYPNCPAVFVDTGLEYPELREFVKTVDNVTWLKPEMNFKKVIQMYGYPVVSKEISQVIEEARRYDKETGKYEYRIKRLNGELLDKSGKKSPYNCEKWKFLLDAPFLISNKCCNVMKKKPAKKYEQQTGNHPFIGTLACESQARRTAWKIHGCNAFDTKRPTSQPLSFWKEQDILQYIKSNNLPYASVYGDIINNNGKYQTTKCDRTGCVFCMYGCHLEKEPNRFQRLKETHPSIYDFCMKSVENGGLGLDDVLNYIKVKHD